MDDLQVSRWPEDPTSAVLRAVTHESLCDALQPVPALDLPLQALVRPTEGRVLVGAIGAVEEAVAEVSKEARVVATLEVVGRAGVVAAEGRIPVASVRAGRVIGHAKGGGGGALVAVRAHELQRKDQG